MIVTNIEQVPGKKILEHYGLVVGSTVRSKNAFKDFGAGFKSIFGGEMKSYTKLLEETREEAVKRLVAQAQQLGANAVVNVRFASSDIVQGASEVYAYGTAVKVE